MPIRDGIGRLAGLVGGMDVFDEEDFVSDFVVDELVDGSLGEEQAVAAGAHALFVAEAGVRGGVFGGVGDGGVSDGFRTEAAAGVANIEDIGARGANGGDVDHLLGVERCAVFHGVEQNFAKGLHHVLERFVRQLLGEFAGEGHEAVCIDKARDHAHGDPSGACGDDFEVVA